MGKITVQKKIFQCENCERKEYAIVHPHAKKKCQLCGGLMIIIGGEIQITLR